MLLTLGSQIDSALSSYKLRSQALSTPNPRESHFFSRDVNYFWICVPAPTSSIYCSPNIVSRLRSTSNSFVSLVLVAPRWEIFETLRVKRLGFEKFFVRQEAPRQRFDCHPILGSLSSCAMARFKSPRKRTYTCPFVAIARLIASRRRVILSATKPNYPRSRRTIKKVRCEHEVLLYVNQRWHEKSRIDDQDASPSSQRFPVRPSLSQDMASATVRSSHSRSSLV